MKGLVVVGMVAGMIAVAVAADRIFTNPKPDAHLKALFPRAVAFSPLEGAPLHFKAYGADPRTTPNPPLLGYAFWTTDLVPHERAYHGPIHFLVGLDLGTRNTKIVVAEARPDGGLNLIGSSRARSSSRSSRARASARRSGWARTSTPCRGPASRSTAPRAPSATAPGRWRSSS